MRQAISDKSEAANEEKEARQSLLEKMEEVGFDRVRVGDKIYEIDRTEKVKQKAVKGDEELQDSPPGNIGVFDPAE